VSPSLRRAYRLTRYRIDSVEVRVDRRSAAVDRLILSHGVRTGTLLTAFNPFSRTMAPGWNRRMQRQLAEAVRCLPTLSGIGCWRRWSEAHLLVLGDVWPSLRVARRFRQNAVVIVRCRQPARLVSTFQAE